MLLDHGHIVADGKPSDTCNLFYQRSDATIKRNADAMLKSGAAQHSTGEIDLLGIQVLDEHGTPTDRVIYHSDITVVIKCRAKVELQKPSFGVGVHTTDFVYLATDNTGDSMHGLKMVPGVYEIRCRIRHLPFLPGVYALRLGISAGSLSAQVFYGENLFFFQVISPSVKKAELMREGVVAWEAEWSAGRVNDSVDRACSAEQLTGT
jgi:hypothetical protein